MPTASMPTYLTYLRTKSLPASEPVLCPLRADTGYSFPLAATSSSTRANW